MEESRPGSGGCGRKWLAAVAAAWGETGGTGVGLADVLARKLGVELKATAAFLEAVDAMAAFAEAPLAEGLVALEEENKSIDAAFRAVRPILEARLQAALSAADAAIAAATPSPTCKRCGGKLEIQGPRERPWGSIVGTLDLTRVYGWCEPCGTGRAMAQELVGLPAGDYTARLEELASMMTTTVTFGMARQLLRELLHVELSEKALKDLTERRGKEVKRRQQAEAERCAPYDEKGLPLPVQAKPVEAQSVKAAPEIAYAEMDGVFPMTRQEIPEADLSAEDREKLEQARTSKARGGKGRKYKVEGKEVKNGVLYTGEHCGQESPSRGCITEKRYVSHLGTWQQFASLLWVQMLALGFDRAKLLVVLSDGAEWIRSFCEWLPVKVLLILDLFHAQHRIWEVAHVLYGEDSEEGAKWARAQCARVEAGKAQEVVQALGFLRPRAEHVRKKVAALAEYLTNNLDRMDYPAYRAMGLRVTSAAVESANYHVTGSRLKLQGMRWDVEGAAQMASLRADLFNGGWETTTKQLLAA